MTYLQKEKKQPQSGFTLIEIVVAAGIFSVLLLVVVGVFSRFIFVQRRDIAEQKMQEDTRFALELFNREARTAYGSTFETQNSNTVSRVYFANQNKQCVQYEWNNTEQSLRRAESQNGSPSNCAPGTVAYGDFEPLTSSDLKISKLTFVAHPAAVTGDALTNQAFITISLTAHAVNKADKVVTLQSTVASRQLIPYTP